MDKFPQILENVTVAEPGKLATDQRLLSEIASHETQMADRGRILVRPSGTEPILRIMVEGQDKQEVGSIARALADHAVSLSAS